MTQILQATYERGVLKPVKRLRLPEHAKVTLIINSKDPVSRTRGAFRLSKRQAKVLIYDDSLLG